MPEKIEVRYLDMSGHPGASSGSSSGRSSGSSSGLYSGSGLGSSAGSSSGSSSGSSGAVSDSASLGSRGTNGLFYHQYIVYTDSEGNEYAARGGSEFGWTGFGEIITVYGEFNPDFIDYPRGEPEGYVDPSETIIEGDDLSSYWESIKDAMDAIEAEGHNYSPTGKNSNAAVEEALERSNLPAPQNDDFNQPGEYWSPTFVDDLPEGVDPDYDDWLFDIPQWFNDLLDDWGKAENEGSPLVLDLDGNGIDLTSVIGTEAVYWDIDEDGFAEKSGWISGNDGLLAIDLNSDGVINNHGELFGTNTTDGFTILSNYDSNTDNVIDASDAQFADLLVWVDASANGYSESDELYSLADLGITSININANLVDYYISDNHITHESTFTINGQTQTIVDAWFAYDNVNSHYQESYTLDFRTKFLPTLRGFGDVKDLHISMSMDETLLLMVQEMAIADVATLFDPVFDLSSKFEDILFRWAGVEDVDPDSRGIYVDGQELAFLEKFFGETYLQQSTFENPGHVPAEILNTLYDQLSKTLLNNILVQGAASVFYENNAHYDFVTGSIENSDVNLVNVIEAGQASIDSSSENDAYVISTQTGNVSLYEQGGLDEIWLSGVDSEDVRLENVSNSHLKIHTGTQTITVINHFGSFYQSGLDGYRIEKLVLDDGTTVDLLNNLTFSGSSGNDNIVGLSQSDTLIGKGGNDQLDASAGNDILIGGTGDDWLYGGVGDDQYVWSVGDGNDIIQDSGGVDYVVLHGVLASEVTTTQSGSHDLKIHIGTETLTVRSQFSSDYYNSSTYDFYQIEKILLDDGTEIVLADNTSYTEDPAAPDIVEGTATSDYLYGASSTSDVLIGNGGDDYLYGDTGDDTYVYNLGDGSDTITDYGGFDTLEFGAGITIDDVRLWKDNNHLEIYIGTDKIKLDNQFHSSYGYEIETATFADGTTLDLLNNLTFTGTTGSDYVYGQTVYDDTLIGGEGDDYLYGDTGDDVYVYNLGDGNDTITDYAGFDKISFGAGITVDDVRFWKDNNHLEIYIGTDKIKLDNQFHSYYGYEIEAATFADGTTLGLLNNLTFTGTSGSDYVYGQSTDNDTLVGGEGDDYLYGDNGDDVYVYNLGDGSDTITDYGGLDSLKFGAGIAVDDIRLWKDNHHLEIYIGVDKIKLDNQFHSSYGYEIETATFADGSTLDLLNNLTFTGSTGSDYVYGQSNANDILVGGEGDDYLYGDTGDDAYVYNLGDGSDSITDYGGVDKLIFGAGITIGDISLLKDGNDLEVHIGSEIIELKGQLHSSYGYEIETAIFADGSILDLVNNLTFTGTSASDSMSGTEGDDTMYGAEGSDYL
ncbi:MAG: calcium-binding protein, partial [Alphaproteobacteria bacterium]